jgi:hypothetical protein
MDEIPAKQEKEEYRIIDQAEPSVMAPVTPEQRKFEQEMKEAPELDFEVTGEHWIRIEASDGADIRFKTVVVGLKRLPDDPKTGEPRYVIKSQNALRVVKKGDREGKADTRGIFTRRR